MTRFTFFEDGHWWIRLNGVVYGDFPEVDRLAAYEDTGLEPEEISEAANRRHDCKIDCLLKEYNAMMDKIQSLGGLDHLNELSQAEKDGRLVVLPCKITDTVYLIESILKGKKVIGEQVISALIDHVTIGGTAGKPVFDICSATYNWYMALEPGEFFLTREEAEAALAEKGERA